MALLETIHDEADPEPTIVTLKLDEDAVRLLSELMRRTGWDASELVGWSLGAYWREMEGIVLPPPMSLQDADRAVAEGLADVEAGRVISHQQVAADWKAKYG